MKKGQNDNSIGLEDIKSNFIIGIDLGTTNSAVSYVDLTAKGDKSKVIQFLDIPQLTAPGELGQRSVLPSFLYIPAAYEIESGSVKLPWDEKREYAVGEIAREQGALVPGRQISSAKSWLCHSGVDRTSNILPWGEGVDIDKVSPVEASSRYLLHIREVWNELIAQERDGYNLEDQTVLITVPASFDEVARELTVKAARQAGINRFRLMEEPLAAFYAWLYQNKETWQKKMGPGQLVLVCDVGGGTTDFTIIAVAEGEDGLCFNRLSVGEHIMLGGDNMDLTIGRHVETKLFGKPYQLDSKRWHQLTHQCRKAKEALLAEGKEKNEFDITLMGTGGKLIANTLKYTLSRDNAEDLIIDGFFPFVSLHDTPKESKRKGLTEWGLPYVQTPAVTQHLATFWQRSSPLLKKETGRENPFPDFVLFNGGSLTPSIIRNRILAVVKDWFKDVTEEDWSPEELENPRPELSVAVGATNYGIARMFDEIRVGAGSPRAYYVEVATSSQETGKTRRAVCLVPRSVEEGYETQLSKPAFEVLANQPVAFNIFSSSTRLDDKLGDVATLPEEEITILPPIHTVLRYGKKNEAIPLPVHLSVRLTEVGTLELWCNSEKTTHRWQLQFDVRLGEKASPQSSGPVETLDMKTIEQAFTKINNAFKEVNGNPESLTKDLIAVLALNKSQWSTAMIRKITDYLLKCRKGRLFSPQHEARWLNLTGFCLRPGFGDPLDDWRIKEIWKVFLEGLRFSDKHQCRTEWRILWRRVAGGLKPGQQMELYKQISPSLQSSGGKKKKPGKSAKNKTNAFEDQEIWMALACLERLSVDIKEDIGRRLLKKLNIRNPNPKELWALSRIGSRIPFHGPLDRVISAKEASVWINTLLSKGPEASDVLAHALVQLARATGDRERDLQEADKDNLLKWLDNVQNGAHYKELITNPDSALGQKDQDWIFGESLPPGLIISEEN